MNMLLMYSVHHLKAEMEGKKTTKCLKAHLKILTYLPYFLIIKCELLLQKLSNIFSCGQNGFFTKWLELK